MVGKKPSVKADLAIYSHTVDAAGQYMSKSLLVTFWSVFVNPVTFVPVYANIISASYLVTSMHAQMKHFL